MRVSTAIIIGIGIIPLGWGAFSWLYLVIMKPPSWDIGIPWTALGIAVGAGIVGVGILKLVLLDWLWAYVTFQRGSRLITGSTETM